jgi:hypothetical protein
MTDHPIHLQDRNETFQKNWKLLPNYLKQQLRHVNFEEIWDRIDITFSKDGLPICHFKDNNGLQFHINSSNPRRQAEHWYDQIPSANIGTLFVYGCGFGYPLFELIKKYKGNLMIVFEQNIYIFMAMLHYFDLEPLFRHSNLFFFIGQVEHLLPDFENFITRANFYYTTAPSVVFTPALRRFKQEYQQLHHHIFQSIIMKTQVLGNDHYDNMLGFHNTIENLIQVQENPYFSSLKDKYNNVPAFIIANGPSLDKSIEELKKIEGKGIILCSESAIISLMKNHLKPDAICILERYPDNYNWHFKDKKYPEDISLLAFTVADPRIFSSYEGAKIPIFGGVKNHFWDLINEEGAELYGGTSAAHLAFECAVYMGANPVVLVGQDLAYGPGGMTHSSHSLYAEETMKSATDWVRSQPVLMVESNEGKQIPTNSIWFQFKTIFEQMIETNPQVTVLNTTEQGTRIKGADCVKLSDVIETYCKNPLRHKLHDLINDGKRHIDEPARKVKLKQLVDEIEKYTAIYKSLDLLTLQRKIKCAQLLDKLEQEAAVDVYHEAGQEYTRNMSYMFEFMNSILHPVYFQQVLIIGFHRMNELGPIHSTKYREGLHIHYEVFDRLNRICQTLPRDFKIAMEKLSPLLEVEI